MVTLTGIIFTIFDIHYIEILLVPDEQKLSKIKIMFSSE